MAILDKLAVIFGKGHLCDGIVRICISVVNPVVHFYRGIVAQLVRPHDLYVHLYGSGADTLTRRSTTCSSIAPQAILMSIAR